MINVTKTSLPPLKKYIKYLEKIWSNNWVTNDGEFSKQLEQKLQQYLKVSNIQLVSNGTIAMQIAFRALHLKGEVITTSFSFPATTNALIWGGLKPVYADIDLETFNIDPKKIENKITKNTSAILAVHVFGNPCDVEEIEKIAQRHNLEVIYDAAHAFGVEYKGQSVLEWGDVSTLSFHAAKTFQTIEGGAVISKNPQINERVKLLRNHGIKGYEEVILAGVNAKMNELQAVMGLSLLDLYDEQLGRRKAIYERYVAAFSGNSKIKLQQLFFSKYNYSYFPIVFQDEKVRNKIFEKLLEHNIRARKYFYPPIHELPYVKSRNNLPITTRISHGILCLPLYDSLPMKDLERIIDLVNSQL